MSLSHRPDHCCVRSAPAAPSHSSQRTASNPRSAFLAAVPVVLAILTPKCPFCVAAYLSALGVGAGAAAAIAPAVRPAALVLGLVALGVNLLALSRWVRRLRARRAT